MKCAAILPCCASLAFQRLLHDGTESYIPLDAVASTQQKTESILKGILELASLLVSVSSCQVLGGSSTSWLASEAYALQEQAQKLLEDKTTQSGRFEWVDGALLRAIENGDWVLLENANMCNPTVLDRLNPLLGMSVIDACEVCRLDSDSSWLPESIAMFSFVSEPGGKLYLNECGSAGGNVRVILPHPRFRLFLALDPRHGDVSRAMRNRGIELCILPTRQGQLASLESGKTPLQLGTPVYLCTRDTHLDVLNLLSSRCRRASSTVSRSMSSFSIFLGPAARKHPCKTGAVPLRCTHLLRG